MRNPRHEADAFYVDTQAQDVATWTMAAEDLCAGDFAAQLSLSDCSSAQEGLGEINYFKGWAEAGSGPTVSVDGNAQCYASTVNTSDAMVNSTVCATKGSSQAGSLQNTYSPTSLSVGNDGSISETIAAQVVGLCSASFMLRAQVFSVTESQADQGAALRRAALFAPILHFDTSEKFRPLNVNSFLGETFSTGATSVPTTTLPAVGSVGGGSVGVSVGTLGQQVCGPSSIAATDTGCRTTTSTASLAGPWGASDYIDIYGSGDASNYHSPNAACTTNGLQDCDSGPASAIYYHETTSPTSLYDFFDYWFFYRLNDFYNELGIGEHEGDWEGVTVAPSLSQPGTFDFVSFSQHGVWYSYSRDVLSCDGEKQAGTCEGINNAPAGQRVDTYPSNGGHTNYPEMCSDSQTSLSYIFSFQLFPCQQDHMSVGTVGLPEKGHDGARDWGNNNAMLSGALIPFPALGQLSWVDFPGRWGNSTDPNQGVGNTGLPVAIDNGGPRSPGCQLPHFTQPDQGGAGTSCGVASGQPYTTRSVQLRSSTQSTTNIGPRDCADWFATDVPVLVCDATVLDAAITRGAFGATPYTRITLSGRAFGGGQGVAQTLGRPLSLGDVANVRLPSTGSARIEVHWLDGTGAEQATIQSVQASGQLLRISLASVAGVVGPIFATSP